MQENIKLIMIWPGWLRLSHWLLASGILFQITSAFALQQQPLDYPFWQDWHLMIGQLLSIALLLRIFLMFRPGSSHWRTLMPTRSDLAGITQMVKFYISFARFPLPNWYAHNPFWKPVYLLFFISFAILVATGVLYNQPYRLAGYSIHSIHTASAWIVTAFTLLHVLAVFLHDLKGKGGMISAMINGNRYFHIDPISTDSAPDIDVKVATYTPIDQLKQKND